MADVDDLRAAFEQAVALFNARDLKAWSTFNHEQLVFFSPAAPFAVDGRDNVVQAMQTLLANSDNIVWKMINPQFRVIDNTGAVVVVGGIIPPSDLFVFNQSCCLS